jgi:nucleoside-diphosphate-sugar epimerase
VNELVELLMRVTGVTREVQHTNRRDVDNIRRRVVNIEKTRRALRWVPEVTLEEGLRRTVEWQRQRMAATKGTRGSSHTNGGRRRPAPTKRVR